MLPEWGEAKTRAVGGGAGSGAARRTSWAGQGGEATEDATAVAGGFLVALGSQALMGHSRKAGRARSNTFGDPTGKSRAILSNRRRVHPRFTVSALE